MTREMLLGMPRGFMTVIGLSTELRALIITMART